VSRGLGWVQRRVMNALDSDAVTVNRGLTLAEFGKRLRDIDRSNRRRAVRSLVSRGKIHVVRGEDGEPTRVRLGPSEQHLAFLVHLLREAYGYEEEEEEEGRISGK
jgi:hypothetical protein